jgi:hypothetical protein
VLAGYLIQTFRFEPRYDELVEVLPTDTSRLQSGAAASHCSVPSANNRREKEHCPISQLIRKPEKVKLS